MFGSVRSGVVECQGFGVVREFGRSVEIAERPAHEVALHFRPGAYSVSLRRACVEPTRGGERWRCRGPDPAG